MQLLHFTTVHRTKTLDFISSSVLLLLLVWQLSFKTTAFEHSYVAANQPVTDVIELNIEHSELDDASPEKLIEHQEFYASTECSTGLLFKPAAQSCVPQSRAPPTLL